MNAKAKTSGDAAGSIARFRDAFRASLEQDTLVKLTLAAYRGAEPDLVKLIVRPVIIRDQKRLSCLLHYRTRDITKNVTVASVLQADAADTAADAGPVGGGGRALAERLASLGSEFLAAHLFTTMEELHLKVDARGAVRLTRAPPVRAARVSLAHDRPKYRHLDPGRPFLNRLGVSDRQGRIIPAMSRKWKQIDKFIEIFAHALASSRLAGRKAVHVVDFGAGKGYLTFAMHDFLVNTLGVEAHVTGVELREDLVRFCNGVARDVGCEGLSFRQGELGDAPLPSAPDVLVALHACDTATDLALYTGIRAGAAILLCAPCCHKEIRPQMRAPETLRPLLRFGAHLAQEADMVTDALRALWLEAAGYQASVFEFISLEHTDKNKMVSGIRKDGPGAADRALAQIDMLKAFYGIREHRLETLLKPHMDSLPFRASLREAHEPGDAR